MIEDSAIKAPKSPFAMRDNEIKVFDGKDGFASMSQAVFKMDMGYLNELHMQILEIISDFGFITSRQIYQMLTKKGIEVKSQDKLNKKLEDMIKSKLVTRYYFSSDEGKGIYRVYCLETNGRNLLASREIKTTWVQSDNTKPVYQLKQRLAGNQVLIAYMQKVAAFRSFTVKPMLFAKRQNMKFTVTGGGVTLVKNDIKIDFIFEVVRRNVGWEEKFMEKMKLYEEFYSNYQAKDCGFDKRPQLVIIGEDDEHIIELFKNVKRINVELKGIELYFSTDLRQLEPEMNKTLISFKQDPDTGRYRMELAEIPLLENK
ncbi:MAG: replication-relaxation family protein [Clostridia bacterium]|nr:replication-relaxation family protein [Clostridia bacterium]